MSINGMRFEASYKVRLMPLTGVKANIIIMNLSVGMIEIVIMDKIITLAVSAKLVNVGAYVYVDTASTCNS